VERAWLAEAAKEIKSQKSKCKSAEKSLKEARRWLDEAVEGLRKAGTQDQLPRGLLARAELYRYQREWDKSRGDLEEAREIAERGGMKLWLADYHLEAARLGRRGEEEGMWNVEVRRCALRRRGGDG
jgi:tetratricopeptide (TPR) repeat protein